jgi:hypothetical protein
VRKMKGVILLILIAGGLAFLFFAPVIYQTPSPIGPFDCASRYFSPMMSLTWYDGQRHSEYLYGTTYSVNNACGTQPPIYWIYFYRYGWRIVL